MSASPGMVLPHLRSLGLDDVDSVVQIETASYAFPWNAAIFTDCIRAGYACKGLFLDTELVGYSVQNWGAHESHLLNLCIHPDCQGRGFGSLLLDQCISLAVRQHSRVMFLEVRPSNPGARSMYQRKGFEVIGRRPGYYQSENGREDALVMQLVLNAGTVDALPLPA